MKTSKEMIIKMTAFMITVSGSPNLSAMAPASREPIGALPMKMSTCTLITRPRNSSGTQDWIMALVVLTTAMNAHPRSTSITRDTGKVLKIPKKINVAGITRLPIDQSLPRTFLELR